MPLSVAQAFNNFLRDTIRFSGDEANQASRSQSYLRDQLEQYARTEETFPNFIPGDFLSGSFGRKTAIKPLDDVDIFMILDGTGLSAVSDGRITTDLVEGSGRRPNPISSGVYDTADNMISSQKVLFAIARALRQTIYPNSRIGNAGQAVNVWLESYELGLDIVPAFHLIPQDSSTDFYYIPSGQGQDGWTETNPKIDAAILDEVGGENISKLRDVIRLLKYWNQQMNRDRLNGYHIEVLALKILANYDITERRYAVEHVLSLLPDVLGSNCSSQTGFGGYIDTYLTSDDRAASVEKARLACIGARLAVDAERDGNNILALAFWGRVFGSAFPQ